MPTTDLARVRHALVHARHNLAILHSRQHPDRHHLGMWECPQVIATADVVEILESRERMLVRAERRRAEAEED